MEIVKEQKLKRIIASFLLISFTFSTVAWSAPTGALLQTAASEAVDGIRVPSFVGDLQIPESLGTVDERHRAAKDGSLSIIHLQDAHASLDAQHSIEKILDHLVREYGVDTIFVEGAVEKLEGKNLQFIENEKANQDLIELLAEDGLVSGAELYLLKDKSRAAQALGVENLELYRNNLKAFQEVYDYNHASLTYLENVKIQISTLASRVFNKTLKEFFREWIFYQDNQSLLMRHLETLGAYAKQQLGADLNDVRQQLEWPQLVRYNKLREVEDTVQFEEANQELRSLVQWLAQQNSAPAYREAVSNYNAQKGFELKKMSPDAQELLKKGIRYFVEGLYDQTRPQGFDFKAYPELSKAWGVAIIREEMDAGRLFAEVQKLTAELLEKMAPAEKEKELLAIYQDYLLLSKTLKLELTHLDEADIQAKGDSVRPSSLEQRMTALQQKKISVPVTNETQTVKQADLAFEKALHFYTLARERDQVIFENMTQQMKNLGKHKAVLITGGFHTQGLSTQMKNKNISYAQVTPHISVMGDHKAYVNAMTLKGTQNPKEAAVPFVRLGQGMPELGRLGFLQQTRFIGSRMVMALRTLAFSASILAGWNMELTAGMPEIRDYLRSAGNQSVAMPLVVTGDGIMEDAVIIEISRTPADKMAPVVDLINEEERRRKRAGFVIYDEIDRAVPTEPLLPIISNIRQIASIFFPSSVVSSVRSEMRRATGEQQVESRGEGLSLTSNPLTQLLRWLLTPVALMMSLVGNLVPSSSQPRAGYSRYNGGVANYIETLGQRVVFDTTLGPLMTEAVLEGPAVAGGALIAEGEAQAPWDAGAFRVAGINTIADRARAGTLGDNLRSASDVVTTTTAQVGAGVAGEGAAVNIITVGVNDSLSAAIASARPGDVLQISPGVHNETTPHYRGYDLSNTQNITFEGVLDANGNRPIIATNHPVAMIVSQGTQLINLEFQNRTGTAAPTRASINVGIALVQGNNQTANNVTISNVNAASITGAGSYVTLENVTTAGASLRGSHNRISNSIFTGTVSLAGNNNLFEGNTITVSGISQTAHLDPYTWTSYPYFFQRHGLDVSALSAGGFMTGNVIANNTLTGYGVQTGVGGVSGPAESAALVFYTAGEVTLSGNVLNNWPVEIQNNGGATITQQSALPAGAVAMASNPAFYYTERHQSGTSVLDVYDIFSADGIKLFSVTKNTAHSRGSYDREAFSVPDVSSDGKYLILGVKSQDSHTGLTTQRTSVAIYDMQNGNQIAPNITLQTKDNEPIEPNEIPTGIRFAEGSATAIQVTNSRTGDTDYYDVVTRVNSRDTNQDGHEAPGDVLLVINHLNSATKLPYNEVLDVNKDGFITPLDALIIINKVKKNAGETTPEGEAAYEDVSGLSEADVQYRQEGNSTIISTARLTHVITPRAEGEAPEIHTTLTQAEGEGPVVPAGWTVPMGSNSYFAFRKYAHGGVVTLQLQDLTDGAIQDLAEQKSSTTTGQASTFFSDNYTVSPNDYPGGPVVVYQIGGSSYRSSSTTVKVQRVSDPSEVLSLPSRFTTTSSFVGAEFAEGGNMTIVTDNQFYHVRVTEPATVIADGITKLNLANTEVPLQLINLNNSVHIGSETPVAVVNLSRTGNGDGYGIAVYDTTRGLGTEDMRYIRNFSITADSNATFTFVRTYGSSSGRNIVAVGLDADHANHTRFFDVATGETLRPVLDAEHLERTVAITSEMNYDGSDLVTFNTLQQDGTQGEAVTVNLDTLTFVTTAAPVIPATYFNASVLSGFFPGSTQKDQVQVKNANGTTVFQQDYPYATVDSAFAVNNILVIDQSVNADPNGVARVQVIKDFATWTPAAGYLLDVAGVHNSGVSYNDATGAVAVRVTRLDQTGETIYTIASNGDVTTTTRIFVRQDSEATGDLTPAIPFTRIPPRQPFPGILLPSGQLDLLTFAVEPKGAAGLDSSITEVKADVVIGTLGALDHGFQIHFGDGGNNNLQKFIPADLSSTDAITLGLTGSYVSGETGLPLDVRVSLVARHEISAGSQTIVQQVEDSLLVTLIPGQPYVTIHTRDLPAIDFTVDTIASISLVSATPAPIQVRLEVAPAVQPIVDSLSFTHDVGQTTTLTGQLTGYDPVQHRLSLYEITNGNSVLINEDIAVNVDGTFSNEVSYQGGNRRFEYQTLNRSFGNLLNQSYVSFRALAVSGVLEPLAASEASRVNGLLDTNSVFLGINHNTGSRNTAEDSVYIPGFGSGYTYKQALAQTDFDARAGELVLTIEQVSGVPVDNIIVSLNKHTAYLVESFQPGTNIISLPLEGLTSLSTVLLLPGATTVQGQPSFKIGLRPEGAAFEYLPVSANLGVADITALPQDRSGNDASIFSAGSPEASVSAVRTGRGVQLDYSKAVNGWAAVGFSYADPQGADWSGVQVLNFGVLTAPSASDESNKIIKIGVNDGQGEVTVFYNDLVVSYEGIVTLDIAKLQKAAVAQERPALDLAHIQSIAAIVEGESTSGTLFFTIGNSPVNNVIAPSLDHYEHQANSLFNHSIVQGVPGLTVNYVNLAHDGLNDTIVVPLTKEIPSGGITFVNGSATGEYGTISVLPIPGEVLSAAGFLVLPIDVTGGNGQVIVRLEGGLDPITYLPSQVSETLLMGLDNIPGFQVYAVPLTGLTDLANIQLVSVGGTPATYTISGRGAAVENTLALAVPPSQLSIPVDLRGGKPAFAIFTTDPFGAPGVTHSDSPLGRRYTFPANIQSSVGAGLKWTWNVDLRNQGSITLGVVPSAETMIFEFKDKDGKIARFEKSGLVPGQQIELTFSTNAILRVSALQNIDGANIDISNIHTFFAIDETYSPGSRTIGAITSIRDRRDTNADGHITSIDVLLGFNELNNPSAKPNPNLDVDGDGVVAPRDSLIIINYINGRSVIETASAVSNPGYTLSPYVYLVSQDGLNNRMVAILQATDVNSGVIKTVRSVSRPSSGAVSPLGGYTDFKHVTTGTNPAVIVGVKENATSSWQTEVIRISDPTQKIVLPGTPASVVQSGRVAIISFTGANTPPVSIDLDKFLVIPATLVYAEGEWTAPSLSTAPSRVPAAQTSFERYSASVDEVLPELDMLFEDLSLGLGPDLDALAVDTARRSELRLLNTNLVAYGERTLPAVLSTAQRVAFRTVDEQLEDAIFTALVNLLAPEIAPTPSLSQESINQALQNRVLELKSLAAAKLLSFDTSGSVILNADNLGQRGPLLKAAIQILVALSSPSQHPSFFMAGAEARKLQQAVLSPSTSGLGLEERGRVSQIFRFAPPTASERALQEYVRQARTLDVPLTASVSEAYTNALESIFRNIENRAEFSNLKTADQLAQAAEAFAVRAYMLLDLAKYLKAEVTDQQPDEITEIIARFFNNLGISGVNVNPNGSFELSLQSVSRYLSSLKAAQQAMAKSA